jgi:hypothetical protein
MRMQNEVEGSALVLRGDTIPDGYNGAKFRKDVQNEVTRLGTEGMGLDDSATYDEAAKIVAARYGVNRGTLSWAAIRADLMKKRGEQWLTYLREILNNDEQPALPGMEDLVKLPQAILIEDEEVVLGDPRLTLAIIMQQVSAASQISEKEAAAYLLRADQLKNEKRRFDDLLAKYQRIVEINPYHLGAEDLVYDRKKKGFVPRQNSSGRA